MLVFSSLKAAANAGYKIVDYDLDRQLFIVENGARRCPVRGKNNSFTILLDEKG